MSKTGVMICGHGSRSQAAVEEFAVLAEKLPPLLPSDWPVEYGYLEFANPVVLGRVRAKQDRLGDENREQVIALLIHGDAAFAGEGIVQETLNLGPNTRNGCQI